MDSPITPISPSAELLSSLSTLLEAGKYSDLTIVCGMRTYNVHRAILCLRSGFFDGACSSPFKEATTGRIDLSEDDPEAVEHMINYFYKLDYLSKQLSRSASQRSSRPSSRGSRSPVGRPRKVNLAMVEDPLLASAAASAGMASGKMSEEETNQLERTDSAKFPDMPMEYEVEEDPIEASLAEQQPIVETPYLMTHAKVYAIAEKYGVTGLKALARKKFATQLPVHYASEEFPDSCQEVYETTVDSDRGLRDLIIQMFRSNPELSLRKDVEAVIRETPGLAFELYRMASGLPVFS